METIISILQNFGFPVAVCFWLMYRTEKVISQNTDAVNSLALILEKRLK